MTTRVLAVVFLVIVITPIAFAGSETPPEGPTWERDLVEARRKAIKRGVPIFVYLTKTYCPHCVKLEEGVLCKKDLEPIYDKAVWLYVFRDFSGSEEDRDAELVALRLGFSSYPQHHLLHPVTLARIATPPRSIDGFLETFRDASVDDVSTTEGAEALARANARARALEDDGTADAALRALEEDDDIVVRYRAVEILADKKPGEIVTRCADLLGTPNDLVRYEVCKVLKARADVKCARALDALVQNPTNSLNPNVVRIRAVEALGACGDLTSVAVIAPFAQGPWNNGLTRISVRALLAIGKRDSAAADVVKPVLIDAYPAPDGKTTRATRAIISLAEDVHKALVELTGRKVAFPEKYDFETVEVLKAAWQE